MAESVVIDDQAVDMPLAEPLRGRLAIVGKFGP